MDSKLKVIGLKNCGKCTITKQILDNKGIEYNYFILTDLPREEQRHYAEVGRNVGYFPLVFRNEQLITLQEV